MGKLKTLLIVNLISSSFLFAGALEEKNETSIVNSLNKMKIEYANNKCNLDIVKPKSKDDYLNGTTNLSLNFKGPEVSCNGEISFDKSQFEDMEKQVKKFLTEVLSNAELFVKAEARKTLVESSINIMALLIVFYENPERLGEMAADFGTCMSDVAENAVDTKNSPGSGDDSNGMFAGVDLGNIAKLTECKAKLEFPEGMSEEETKKLQQTKQNLKDLVDILLNGNIDLAMSMGELHSKSWCDTAKDEFSKDGGLLLEQMGLIALMNGDIISSKATIEDADKTDEQLLQESQTEKAFDKSISRSVSSITSLIKKEGFQTVSFMDMTENAYAFFIQQTKEQAIQLSNSFPNITDTEKEFIDWLISYMYDFKIKSSSEETLPSYYYTLFYMNKPISYYLPIYLNMKNGASTEASYDENSLNYKNEKWVIFNEKIKSFKYNTQKSSLIDYKRVRRFLDGINKYFISKYEYVKTKKYEIYHKQIPTMYGHVENKSLNHFFDIDKIAYKIKSQQEERLFMMQMMLKKLTNAKDERNIDKLSIRNGLEMSVKKPNSVKIKVEAFSSEVISAPKSKGNNSFYNNTNEIVYGTSKSKDKDNSFINANGIKATMDEAVKEANFEESTNEANFEETIKKSSFIESVFESNYEETIKGNK